MVRSKASVFRTISRTSASERGKAADGDRGHRLVGTITVTAIARLSVHPADRSPQSRHDELVGVSSESPASDADQENVTRRLRLLVELLEMFLERGRVAGAGIRSVRERP